MKSLLLPKKGQLSISDAPKVVMIVGFVFLLMATVAYVSSEYRVGIGADESATVTNETVTAAQYSAGYTLSGASNCSAENFAITSVTNGTTSFTAGNYSVTDAGVFTNSTATEGEDWNVSYTYDYGATACDVTEDLETELGDNTSIAGVVLTIALIGIVLSILIGVFMGFRTRRL